MFHCHTSWSGRSSRQIKKKHKKKPHKRGLVNFHHSFVALCLSKSQRGWSPAEHTKGRGKTSLTTTKSQGGCTTIYNLPSLLCDSRGGWREGGMEGERERDRHTDREWPVNSGAEEKTIVLFFFLSLHWGPL